MLVMYYGEEKKISSIWTNMERRIACVFRLSRPYRVHQCCQFCHSNDSSRVGNKFNWNPQNIETKQNPSKNDHRIVNEKANEMNLTHEKLFWYVCKCAYFLKRTLMMNDLIEKKGVLCIHRIQSEKRGKQILFHVIFFFLLFLLLLLHRGNVYVCKMCYNFDLLFRWWMMSYDVNNPAGRI